MCLRIEVAESYWLASSTFLRLLTGLLKSTLSEYSRRFCGYRCIAYAGTTHAPMRSILGVVLFLQADTSPGVTYVHAAQE